MLKVRIKQNVEKNTSKLEFWSIDKEMEKKEMAPINVCEIEPLDFVINLLNCGKIESVYEENNIHKLRAECKIKELYEKIIIDLSQNYVDTYIKSINSHLNNFRELLCLKDITNMSCGIFSELITDQYDIKHIISMDFHKKNILYIVDKYGVDYYEFMEILSTKDEHKLVSELKKINNDFDLSILLKLIHRKRNNHINNVNLMRLYELKAEYDIKNTEYYTTISFHNLFAISLIAIMKQGINIVRCPECGVFFVKTNNNKTCSRGCKGERIKTTKEKRKSNSLYNDAIKIKRNYENAINNYNFNFTDERDINSENALKALLNYYRSVMNKANDIILSNDSNNKELFSEKYEKWIRSIKPLSKQKIRNIIDNNKLEVVVFDFDEIDEKFETLVFTLSEVKKIDDLLKEIK